MTGMMRPSGCRTENTHWNSACNILKKMRSTGRATEAQKERFMRKAKAGGWSAAKIDYEFNLVPIAIESRRSRLRRERDERRAQAKTGMAVA